MQLKLLPVYKKVYVDGRTFQILMEAPLAQPVFAAQVSKTMAETMWIIPRSSSFFSMILLISSPETYGNSENTVFDFGGRF